jgi:acyl transferase domain-containing protein/NAD(P)H-dependent flavin oxidoreductase YrpB (nitropropane dioxygenase family)
MLSRFEFAALTLPGLADPSVAIAASRAGQIGVVDVSLVGDERSAVTAVETFARLARSRGGVRLDPREVSVVDAVVSALPPLVDVVILAPADPDVLGGLVERLRARGVRLWLEATTMEEARLAAGLGCDGVVAKGHEAGGRISDMTTFVLLQQLRAQIDLPVWAHGGIGAHSAAACAAAGAAGVVLDAQLSLCRESTLPEAVKTVIARMDGGETTCVGGRLGEGWRLLERPGHTAATQLRRLEAALVAQEPGPDREAAWYAAVAGLVGWSSPSQAWLLGQDASFAAGLAARSGTVAGVLAALQQAVDERLTSAARLRPLAEGGPLAIAHGTRYPIVQGPMTRVSDVPGFAAEVAEAGALPFLALALLRGPQVETLLADTQKALGGRPWGAGILGFVPLELREEQLAALRRHPPSFALIAGGRPDQAAQLEQAGVPTYLHVPSPGLLRLFAQAGARRFVLEGRECGGHVGPRTSFVLWNTMIDTLIDALPSAALADCHVLFAGGVHDARSAAMVSAMAAGLADRGAKIGVLLGTAYLFTAEAVSTGAITPTFQRHAAGCTATVLLETGPGHATRCADTPFASAFEDQRRRMTAQGLPGEEIRARLELLNLGRARIASKGITRNPDRSPRHSPDGAAGGGAPEFVTLTADEQAAQGMYMLGQLAALREDTVTIPALHHDVCAGSAALLDQLPRPAVTTVPAAAGSGGPCDVAIIGMSCILPKAPNLDAYWQNILDKVDAIVEVPGDRWDWRTYYDPDPAAEDKVYSRWGGFLDAIAFDPVRHGIPPTSLRSIEPLQLLALEAVERALDDAGCLDRPFPRHHTGIILGVSGSGDLGTSYRVRAGLPAVLAGAAAGGMPDTLPAWTSDSFPGTLLNVVAGRVANRFDLGGVNCTVDAACAASLASVYLAVRELEAGTADLMIAGGADTTQTPHDYLCFSKTRALSPRGRCRPLDAGADGIAISEGLGVLVLKRLADAERDGDRVYAVIKGIGASSDGRDRSLTAPRPEGQALALERAYAKAGFSPASVGLVEAHGTGTVAGDRAEIAALTQVFSRAGAPLQGCAIGSVKSMIGHTKATAGVAGLIKAVLGLHHRVLPPTLGVERPNPAAGLDAGPFYVNSRARPWLRAPGAPPRRAGVSAFGFGGTNFHVAIEEHAGGCLPRDDTAPLQGWPTELCVWTAASAAQLAADLDVLDRALAAAPAEPPLREIAHALWTQARPGLPARLAIVTSSIADLRSKLAGVGSALAWPAGEAHGPPTWPRAEVWSPGGVYATATPLAGQGTVAFLYPGQGSQRPHMLADLALCFSEVREAFELADAVLAGRLDRPLSAYVFPPPGFSPDDERVRAEALTRTDRAQPALGAAETGLTRLLAALGVRPGMVAGHSYGEYVALCAAGTIGEDALYEVSHTRGRCIVEAAEADLGTMAAVAEAPARVQQALGDAQDVWVANLNAPRQTVISGTRAGITQAVARLGAAGISATKLPVACGFHSPLVAPARDMLAHALARVPLAVPRLPVYANATADPYPADPARIASLLTDHLVKPVRFAEQIERMHAAGARLFIEVGPGAVLTGLVAQTLHDRPHLAIAAQGREGGLTGLQHALAQLHAHGVDLDLDRLWRGRITRRLRLDALGADLAPPVLPQTAWLVDGGSARPLHAPAPAWERPAPAHEPSTKHGQRDVVAPPSQPTTAPPADGVMLRFQQVMRRFLDTQQEIMSLYLQDSKTGTGTVAGAGPVPGAAPARPEPPSAQPQDAQPQEDAQPQDADRIAGELVRLVAERTGYPPEMLGLDVDLEADLGIDSIKRVEILGAAQQSLPSFGASMMGEERMEPLTRARTLRELVEAVIATGGAEPAAREAQAVQAVGETASAGAAEVPRFMPAVVDAPLSTATSPVSGVVVITDDEEGIARDLATLLRAGEVDVALIRDRRGASGVASEVEPDAYAADLGDPAAARGLVEAVRRWQGPIGALVHLSPLRAGAPFEALDAAGWQARLSLETNALFHLAQAVANDLRGAHRSGVRGRLLAAVCMDGAFGIQQTGSPFQPSQGGVAGLVKTLAQEWPEVGCRVVDVGPALTDAPARLAAELGTDDGQAEAGWSAGRRIALHLVPAPRPDSAAARPLLDPDGVLLVTGGARGITAAVTRELAVRFRPTILLVGRSPLPEEAEAAGTAGTTDPGTLKAMLASRLGHLGSPATPALVERAYRRLLADREIRANLAAMSQAGARVCYHQVDVRDAGGLTQLIDDAYDQYGRIDGVIHGAGVIEDRLIEDQTSAAFERVMDTKTLGAFTLAKALRPERLRFFVLFSSISARLGNPGQGDYAAANEVLNKLAAWLDSRWSARVVSLGWGPWKRTGMVSEQVARLLTQRGMQLITPESGAAALIEELDRGRKGDVEVVLGGGPWQAPPQAATPLLDGAKITRTPQGTVLERTLDPDRDPYLRDHRLDGHPVLPAAAAMELIAEAAAGRRPGHEVTELRGVQVLKGVILDDGPRPIVIATGAAAPDGDAGTVIGVTITDARTGRLAYRAEVVLRPALPTPPQVPARPSRVLEPFPMPVEQAYDALLFHGPLLRGITRIEGIDDDGMVAALTASSPRRFLARPAAGGWIVDPVLVDSGFQLAILWARTRLGMTPLPSRIGRYRRFGALPDGPVRCDLHGRVRTGGHILDTRFAFTDAEGRLLAVIEDMELTASRSLNRLAGAVTGGMSR